LIPIDLSHGLYRSEFQHGLPARFLRQQTGGQVFFGLQREMFLNLGS
jgi:hypothetical protein